MDGDVPPEHAASPRLATTAAIRRLLYTMDSF
jgi:hypothetical protein